jgi:hypothetical protein
VAAPTVAADEDDSTRSRLGRNPGGWGVSFGAGIVLVSLFLVWMELTNDVTGEASRVRAISSFSGQTLFFAALLAIGAGAAIAMVSSSGARIAWSTAALLLGALFIAAAAWAIFDPTSFVERAAKAELFADATSQWEMQDASARVAAALASGTVTASAGIGAFVALAGGALTVLGGLLSFRRPSARA